MPSRRHVVSHSRNLSSRTDRAAGSTPAHLPDELCGPVVVRKVTAAVAGASSQSPSLLDLAADRIEQLLCEVARLEEVRVRTITQLDEAEARATALESELARTKESLDCADARIIELEDDVRRLTTEAESDTRARDRLSALLNPSA